MSETYHQLGFGLIGCGAMGRIHAGNLLMMPGVRLIAVSDPIEASCQRLGQEFEIPNQYADYHDLLARADIDAVLIAVPNMLHKDVTLAALASNKHVLLEKPLAHSVADGAAIVQAAEQSDRVAMLGFNNRFTSEARALYRAATAGRFGTVYYARARWLRRQGLPPRASWFTSQASAGGGALIDIGVHMLDLALHVMGNPRPVSAFGAAHAHFGPARARTTYSAPNAQPGLVDHFDVEDFAAGMVRLADGATLQVETSWASFISRDDDLILEILGSKGGARLINAETDSLSIFTTLDGEQVDVTPRLAELDGHHEELGAFIAAIRAGAPTPVRMRDGLQALEVIHAIYESARTGTLVSL